MNIIKLQDELRSVPDNALIGYVQNPTSNVPSYLALTELNRRKEMREKYQSQQAPESSVAEDLEQQAASQAQPQQGLGALAQAPQQMPQQAMAPQPEMPTQQMAQGGVAGLDVGDMYNEENYASGGIVAFAGPEGSYVIPSKTPQEYYQAIQGNKDFGKSFMFNKFETPYDEAINYYSGLKQNTNDPESRRQLDDAVQALQMQKYRFTRSKEDPTERMTQTGLTDISSSNKPIPESLTTDSIEKKMAGNNPPASKLPTSNPVDEVKKGATGQKQVDETPVTKPIDVIGDPYYFEKRPEDIAGTERDRYKQMYGDDPFVERGEKRLKDMDTRASKLEKQAPWMALAEAGFNMANTRAEFGKAAETPFASAARGASVGLKSYGESQKQLAELEEKRFNVDSKIADAERAVKLAAMQHGFKSEEYNKASNDLAKIENIKGVYDIEKYKVLAGTKETEAVMKQKQDLSRDRAKYLEKNYSIKNALDTYMNKAKFDKLPETVKKSILENVETYNIEMKNLQLSYPLSNMDLSTRDPFALLSKIRS